MKRYWNVMFVLCIFWAYAEAEAGTLTLENGEVLKFDNEKEFVEILLEEFLPPDFSGKTGYFIASDPSSEKTFLKILLVHPEELDIHEYLKTVLYLSIEEIFASQEYKDTVSSYGRENVFAVEFSLEEFDMIFVYTIEPSATRSAGSGSKAFIDARGEGHFEFIEE